MAGPITHMLVSQATCDPTIVAIDGKLRDILNGWQPFLLLGSVGPDLPAILDAALSQRASDLLHDGKQGPGKPPLPTNITACDLYAALKGGTANRAEFAFLLGYVSHTVTDAIVHPIVNEISGGVSNVHLNCETCEDSLLYADVMGGNIKNSNYLKWLETCKTRPHDLAATIALWQSIIEQYYGNHDVERWVWSYEKAFSIARQVYHIDAVSYPAPSEVTSAEVARFYSHVPLPLSDATGHFRTKVFDKAVAFVAQLWQQIYLRFVAGADQIGDLVRAWNMNTGEDMTTGQAFDLWR